MKNQYMYIHINIPGAASTATMAATNTKFI